MTIWCNACRCHVRTPCTSHHLSKDQHPSSFYRRFRSTKGASKARRDHINHEIRNMSAMLPITPEDQERLSYLHSMAAICTYIRKSVLFQGFPSKGSSHCSLPYEAFLRALHGFILVTTTQGKLVYVSENVTEYSGISMVDVLQGDSLYDMIEQSDIDIVKSNLEIDNISSPERSFVCSMQTSKAFKLQNGSCCSVLVQGSFQFFPQPGSPSSSTRSTNEPLFVALCTPTVNRLKDNNSQFCHKFSSVHRLDMTFAQVSDSVLYYLGYSSEEITNRSWYSLIHPDDLPLSAESHKSLVQADEGCQVQIVLRLQCKDLSWSWFYTRTNKDPESISCTNYIISETEARFLQQKINSDVCGPVDSCHSASQQAPSYKSSKCLKRHRTSSSQSDEPCARKRRDSEQDQLYVAFQGDCSPVPPCESPAMFTPPYTPSSSCSSLSHDLLMDVHGYSDQLLSSPEGSPSYYSYTQASLTGHQSPSESLPSAAEQTFDQAALGPLSSNSTLSSSSPSYDFPACTSDARLVPDCLSVSDTCESPADCTLHQDDFSLLELPQGGSVVHLHHVPEHALPIQPSLLTPSQSPTSQETFEYSERERAEISILAQQISSLANSFDMFHTLSPVLNTSQHSVMNDQVSTCTWPQHTPLSSVPGFKRELVLDECMFDSILNELDLVTRKRGSPDTGVIPLSFQQHSRNGACQLEQVPLGLYPNITDDALPADQFTSSRISMDQNNGLHQLNHYIHSSLQQDGRAEENLY